MLQGQTEPMLHQRLQMMLGSKNNRALCDHMHGVLNTALLGVTEVQKFL